MQKLLSASEESIQSVPSWNSCGRQRRYEKVLASCRKRAFIDYTETNVVILSSRLLLPPAVSVSLVFYGKLPRLSLLVLPSLLHNEIR
jgi:hypothetical protein